MRLIAVPIFPNRCVGANWENGRYKVLGSAVAALRNPHRRGEGVLAVRIAGTIRTAGTTRRQRLVGTPRAICVRVCVVLTGLTVSVLPRDRGGHEACGASLQILVPCRRIFNIDDYFRD